MYAQVINNIVTEIISKPKWIENGLPASDAFMKSRGVYPVIENRPSYDDFYQIIKYDENVGNWNVLENHVEPAYIITDYSLQEVLDKQILILKNIRKQYECGGFSVTTTSGKSFNIHSDRESQATIVGKFVAVNSGLVSGDTLFKTTTGWIALNPTDVQETCIWVAQNVQACFVREHAIQEAYKACTTVSQLKDIVSQNLHSSWPASCLYQSI